MRILLSGIILCCQCFIAVGQLHFVAGSYYDLKGNKIDGFIALSPTAYVSWGPIEPRDAANSFIYFKKDSLEVESRIKGWKLKAFTLGIDSFAVLRNFQIIGVHHMVSVPIAFCRVLIAKGKVLLYTNSYSEFSSQGGLHNPKIHVGETANFLQSYLLQQNGSEKITSIKMGLDEFIEQMSFYFKMSDEIVSRIKGKEYSYRTTEKLVNDFNAWYAKHKGQK
jgi:hypothetical protein